MRYESCERHTHKKSRGTRQNSAGSSCYFWWFSFLKKNKVIDRWRWRRKLRATSEAAALSDLIKITIDLVSEWVACPLVGEAFHCPGRRLGAADPAGWYSPGIFFFFSIFFYEKKERSTLDGCLQMELDLAPVSVKINFLFFAGKTSCHKWIKFQLKC